MSKPNKAIVVIPVYKLWLSESEIISLNRCYKILSNYDIVFVAPLSLTAEYLENKTTFRFDDFYFQNIKGYNTLMLSSLFYEAFSKYEYMLVYQLDAFVFSDKLLYWCNKNLDYIGASWVAKKRGFRNGIRQNISVQKYLKTLKNKQNFECDLQLDLLSFKRVGNGGFSLRKIDAFIKITKKYSHWIQKIIENEIPEDTFWGVLLNLYQANLITVGTYRQGISFAFEMNPARAYRLNWNCLPFGCHDFEDWDKQFWKRFIR